MTLQKSSYQQAINHVVEAYKSVKNVGFHCGGGKGRTSAVAIGTLITLGKSENIKESTQISLFLF
ncbi:hypothetical protein ASG93_29880 [Paenibacillus sp. Soil787]|nr:hypothetical protein ASG93_29880 [Paenibacillus sp. Soil787]